MAVLDLDGALRLGRADSYMAHVEAHRDRVLECYDRVKKKAAAGNPGAKVRLAEYDAILKRYGVELDKWRGGGD